MKFWIFLLLLAPVPALAINDNYDPTYTPYNVEEAIEHKACEDEVEDFDDSYWDLQSDLLCGFEGSCPNEVLPINDIYNLLKVLELAYEADFADSLNDENVAANYKTEEDGFKDLREGVQRCSINLIQENLFAHDGRWSEEINECYLERCYWDEIDDFSTQERIRYNKGIAACEAKQNPEPVKIEPVVVPTPAPVYEPPVIPAPADIEPAATPFRSEIIEPQEESLEPLVATSSATTTEEATVELTQDELNKLVEEQVSQALAEQEEAEPEAPVEEPGFVARVVNFLFGWLW